MGRPHEGGSTPARVAGLLAFVLPLALYAQTLAPTVTLEDSGEFITAAYWLGVPHAPGYPLWCLLVHPFTWIPWGTVAERVHLACAVFGAATTWLVYLCGLRIVRDPSAALFGALALGGSTILWSQSVVAEVYSLNAMLSVLLLYLGLRWQAARTDVWLYGLAFVVGIGMTNHYLLALVALPVFLWLLTVDARSFLRARLLVGGAALFALGFSVYLYLPIRAATDPPVNVGMTNTAERAIRHVQRSVYSEPTEIGRTAGEAGDVVSHTAAAWRGTERAFGWPVLLLALFGLVAWPRAKRDVLLLTLVIAAGTTLGLNTMMAAPATPYWVFAHRVYYISVHAMVALWFAAGVADFLARAARVSSAGLVGAALVVVLSVGFTVWHAYPLAHRQDDRRAESLALDVLDSAPPGAGFFPAGDDIIYPVLYERWVAAVRPDVNIISKEYGWRGQPYGVLLAGDPLTDQMRADVPALRDFVSVPRGILYAWVRRDEAPAQDYGAFVPLPGEPRDQQLDYPATANDVFASDLRARYAAYYARLGALRLQQGDGVAARTALERAEALNSGSAFVGVLLYEIHRDFDLPCERRLSLLERARRDNLASFDPFGSRYAPVGLEEIDAYLDEARRACGPTGG